MKDIKDHLHLYLGVTFHTANSEGEVNATTLPLILRHFEGYTNFKLILRPLSSMTEEESNGGDFLWTQLDSIKRGENQVFTPVNFIYLLKLGFDLFGLISEGLAIEEV